MTFVEFYHRSATSEELIPACGDRAVVILDGRSNPGTHHRIAADECTKRGYLAYRICRGETFSRAEPVTGVIRVA